MDDLIRNLSHTDTRLQADAAQQLAGMQEDAQPAILDLVKYCGSENEDVSNWCTAALESVGPPTSQQISDLIEYAKSDCVNIAYWAITMLGRAGPLALSSVGIIRDRINNTANPAIQRRAEWALKRIESTDS